MYFPYLWCNHLFKVISRKLRVEPVRRLFPASGDRMNNITYVEFQRLFEIYGDLQLSVKSYCVRLRVWFRFDQLRFIAAVTDCEWSLDSPPPFCWFDHNLLTPNNTSEMFTVSYREYPLRLTDLTRSWGRCVDSLCLFRFWRLRARWTSISIRRIATGSSVHPA